ncbi:MAG: DUF4243 domain-containing protein [Nannocystaceae bacterium]|nr:DUF4243 domain-containing protein [Nannocystaceae bacterium]
MGSLSIGDAKASARALDDALTRLHATDLEYRSRGSDGLSNHGPMAAETLEALGATDKIGAFIDGYTDRLRPYASASGFDWAGRVQRLGDATQGSAWVATVQAHLQAAAEPDARFGELVVELLPGYVAAAMHGPLRAAHAWRAWGRHRSEARARELAFGLAYWATRYQTLPGTPGALPQPGVGVLATLRAVPIVDPSRRNDGLIFEQARVLDGDPAFAAVIESIDLAAATPERALTELASAGAKLYLRTPAARFTYMHTLTGSVALRRLGSAIPAAAMPKAVGYGLQAVAALLAINGAPAGWDAPWTQATAAKPEAITQAAIGSDDDHTIKFVEAALSEHARTPRPEFLAAAAHRVGMR